MVAIVASILLSRDARFTAEMKKNDKHIMFILVSRTRLLTVRADCLYGRIENQWYPSFVGVGLQTDNEYLDSHHSKLLATRHDPDI
jgi:hypothetical protein